MEFLLYDKRDHIGYMSSSFTVQARLRQGGCFSRLEASNKYYQVWYWSLLLHRSFLGKDKVEEETHTHNL